MKYIESPFVDAYDNMALEEFVFEGLPAEDEYFMLWQNKNAVVVGKYQNTVEEINQDFVRKNGIQVVRRLSGGGAMYQDMGNLNFTFVVKQEAAKSLDFEIFIQPVVHALAQLGVRAEMSSRNDIVIEGKKFSGNSQYNKRGRTMHHGTMLFCSDLNVIQDALRVKADKIESKGIKSVRSHVTNIADFLPKETTLEEFKDVLLRHMFDANSLQKYELTEHDLKAVKVLRDEKYATWEWNYGRSPAYGLRKERRYDFGGIALSLDVKEGKLCSLDVSGDFFGNGDIGDLANAMKGCQMRAEALEEALKNMDVEYYIRGMSASRLIEMILY